MNIVEQIPLQRPWKGIWLMGVAGIHTLVGLVVFHPTLAEMAAQGFFDTVGEDPMRGTATWFLFFGLMLFAFGLAVFDLERHSQAGCRPALAVGLLLIIALGILLMPVSGFWLAFPPALALLRNRQAE